MLFSFISPFVQMHFHWFIFIDAMPQVTSQLSSHTYDAFTQKSPECSQGDN